MSSIFSENSLIIPVLLVCTGVTASEYRWISLYSCKTRLFTRIPWRSRERGSVEKERKEITKNLIPLIGLRSWRWFTGFGQIYNRQWWKLPILYEGYRGYRVRFVVEHEVLQEIPYSIRGLHGLFERFGGWSGNALPGFNSSWDKLMLPGKTAEKISTGDAESVCRNSWKQRKIIINEIGTCCISCRAQYTRYKLLMLRYLPISMISRLTTICQWIFVPQPDSLPSVGGTVGLTLTLIFKGGMRFVFLWLCAILFSGVVYGESDRDSLKVRLGAPRLNLGSRCYWRILFRRAFIERLDELYSKWYVTRLGERGLRGFGLSDRNGDRAICAWFGLFATFR